MTFKFSRIAILSLCLGLGVSGLVQAADPPQTVREGMMKKMGGALGALAAIAKGEKPYDAAVVKSSLTTMDEVAKAFPDQFPKGSETGFKTEASPKIWQDMDGFKKHAEALQTAAEAELAALPADQAAVGAAMKKIAPNCAACHQDYRLKK
ncbi:cytochrome c [Allorhizobium sp. BGMRC 0089]|uniref:c-type cytochrome n=1 Tax=Allorhizobium sonneratiae TaxID=2934936 RepID=UPI0020332316|nr:cytochrome c [Allorhizobium sonneratiae]MCM2291848.1 cytochrome c [Allorhizobium sonneratiae]